VNSWLAELPSTKKPSPQLTMSTSLDLVGVFSEVGLSQRNFPNTDTLCRPATAYTCERFATFARALTVEFVELSPQSMVTRVWALMLGQTMVSLEVLVLQVVMKGSEEALDKNNKSNAMIACRAL